MGLFSKEPCAFCGNPVGALSRTRLASKECICNDCSKKTHEFARLDWLTLDEVKALMASVPEMEARFDAVCGGSKLDPGMGIGKRLFYYSTGSQTCEFAFTTPETKRYGHKYIFSFFDLKPYETHPKYAWESQTERIDAEYVKLEERKSGDRVDGYYLCFPYNDKAIRNVRINLQSMSKQDAEHLAWFINSTRKSIFTAEARAQYERRVLERKNMYATANAVREAIRSGGDVQQAVAEGAQRTIDIREGRIRKKSLFEKLRGKKDLDRN